MKAVFCPPITLWAYKCLKEYFLLLVSNLDVSMCSMSANIWIIYNSKNKNKSRLWKYDIKCFWSIIIWCKKKQKKQNFRTHCFDVHLMARFTMYHDSYVSVKSSDEFQSWNYLHTGRCFWVYVSNWILKLKWWGMGVDYLFTLFLH